MNNKLTPVALGLLTLSLTACDSLPKDDESKTGPVAETGGSQLQCSPATVRITGADVQSRSDSGTTSAEDGVTTFLAGDTKRFHLETEFERLMPTPSGANCVETSTNSVDFDDWSLTVDGDITGPNGTIIAGTNLRESQVFDGTFHNVMVPAPYAFSLGDIRISDDFQFAPGDYTLAFSWETNDGLTLEDTHAIRIAEEVIDSLVDGGDQAPCSPATVKIVGANVITRSDSGTTTDNVTTFKVGDTKRFHLQTELEQLFPAPTDMNCVESSTNTVAFDDWSLTIDGNITGPNGTITAGTNLKDSQTFNGAMFNVSVGVPYAYVIGDIRISDEFQFAPGDYTLEFSWNTSDDITIEDSRDIRVVE